jgi:(2Fe-2S) ferredoxin
LGTQLQSKELSLVVCGRFDEVDEDAVVPDTETKELIDLIVDRVQRKELHPYVSINFCNCGNAYDHGPSVTVLPEKVRYLDVDDATIENILDRHVESVIREGDQ